MTRVWDGNGYREATKEEEVALLADDKARWIHNWKLADDRAKRAEAQRDSATLKVAELERLLDRAYPLLHNPYRESADAFNWALYDSIIHEVEQAIQHLKEEDDPERVNLALWLV
jgi:glutamyl-tRNA reductase